MRRIILSIALLLAVLPAAAHAAPAIPKLRPIMTTYDVYVGGLHFLTADILFQEEKNTYNTHLHARTAGYFYSWLKWDGDISSTGAIKGDHFVPAVYQNNDVWKDKPKLTKLNFDRKGGIKAEFNPPNTDQGREAVTDQQKHGALDPVTALLQMLAHVAVDKSCDATVPVFDGKRRFDLLGQDRGEEMVDDSDYSAYKGPARVCAVDFNMIAGEWKDREKNKFWQRESGESGRDTFHIWLASVDKGMPELPVRLESTSAFGNVIIHLTKWHYATPDEVKN